jgi:hypothetical protein
MFGHLSFNGIGSERSDDSSATWYDSEKKSKDAPADNSPYGVAPVFEVWEKVLDLRRQNFSLDFSFKIFNHFGDTKETHDRGNKPNPV